MTHVEKNESAAVDLPIAQVPCDCDGHPCMDARNLSLYYGNKPAFLDVTLPVHVGYITALIGPSGSGKTSFLMALNRLTDLIPGCRVMGNLQLGALDILHPQTDVVALRRRVGMIFQKPNPFPFSIRRNLTLPLREHGVRDRHRLEEKTESVLRDVGLWDEVKDRLNESALTLSGGQQQRLCLARALALEPEIILLDEPCGSLDPIATAVVEERIASLRGRYTVVIVTHNLAQARRIADRAALLWVQDGGGRLIEQGPIKQLFETPVNPLTSAYVNGQKG